MQGFIEPHKAVLSSKGFEIIKGFMMPKHYTAPLYDATEPRKL